MGMNWEVRNHAEKHKYYFRKRSIPDDVFLFSGSSLKASRVLTASILYHLSQAGQRFAMNSHQLITTLLIGEANKLSTNQRRDVNLLKAEAYLWLGERERARSGR